MESGLPEELFLALTCSFVFVCDGNCLLVSVHFSVYMRVLVWRAETRTAEMYRNAVVLCPVDILEA